MESHQQHNLPYHFIAAVQGFAGPGGDMASSPPGAEIRLQ